MTLKLSYSSQSDDSVLRSEHIAEKTGIFNLQLIHSPTKKWTETS